MNFNKLFEFAPQITDIESGAEPSLTTLLYCYYADHDVPHKQAVKYTEQYIAAIKKEFD